VDNPLEVSAYEPSPSALRDGAPPAGRWSAIPAGWATAAIGRVMIDMLGADCRPDSALTTIAEKARVSVATVKRALV
jgi:hypothetical protein